MVRRRHKVATLEEEGQNHALRHIASIVIARWRVYQSMYVFMFLYLRPMFKLVSTKIKKSIHFFDRQRLIISITLFHYCFHEKKK